MKKIALFSIFVLFFLVLNARAYSGSGIPFLYGNNDSLLFDDDGDNSVILSDEDCAVRVLFVKGATGDVWRESIKKVCGVPDTITEMKKDVKLRMGDFLVEGSKVKVDANKDSYAELLFYSGEDSGYVTINFKLGPNSTFEVPNVDDLCKALYKKTSTGPIKEDFKQGKLLVDMKEQINNAEILILQTANTVINHIFTKFSIEVNVTGTDTVDIIKVYEGSVSITPPKKNNNSSNKNNSAADAQKLMEDYRNGKITNEELQKKLKELTQNMENTVSELLPVTVDAGNKCTATNGKLTVEPIESNDDRWWEGIGK